MIEPLQIISKILDFVKKIKECYQNSDLLVELLHNCRYCSWRNARFVTLVDYNRGGHNELLRDGIDWRSV